jgi:hypothetical protein
MERSFWVNDTLGFLSLRRRARAFVAARFRVARPARVTASIWTAQGALVRRLERRAFAVGMHVVSWNGRLGGGRLARRGAYVFRIHARNRFGPAEIARRVFIRR